MSNLTWQEWCEVFNDFTYFENIIATIMEKHNLGEIDFVDDVTPGTNAVFRVNDFIVKVFVPVETKIWEEDDYINELESIQHALNEGASTPNIVANGSIILNQEWRYIVFDYIDSDELGYIIHDLPKEEQDDCLDQISLFLHNYNIRMTDNSQILRRGLISGRWKEYDKRLINDIESYISNMSLDFYKVHGDLTKENVLYDGDVYIIDFADSCIAPKCYEYPPIAFDLFDYNLELTQDLFKEPYNELIDNLLNGLLIHDFGGDILSNILIRLHLDKTELLSVNDIRDAIIDIMK